MSNKNLIKLIEKEVINKSKKQTKFITSEFDKTYSDIKNYIELKFEEDCKIIKEEIRNMNKQISLQSLLEDFKKINLSIDQSIIKYENIIGKLDEINNKVVRFTRIREKLKKDILKKLEDDSQNIKTEIAKLN